MLVIRSSTLSSNSALDEGGGLFMTMVGVANTATASLLVQDSTITGNTCSGVAGGVGISVVYGPVTFTNSIISGNTSPVDPDLYNYTFNAGSPVTANYSAFGSTAGFTLTATSGNNLPPGANLMLGPLANNGGPTLTQAPLAGSPLIHAGSNALVPADLIGDQRGAQYRRIFGGTVDIGAVEVQPPIPVPAGDARHIAILAAALAGTALARLRKSRVTGSG
jgi:hypothetical protein